MTHPDNVAPAVAYIASERSDWLNGQVILAAGYDIGLYNVPQIVSQITSDGPWDLETAFDLMDAAFPIAVQPNVDSEAGEFAANF